MYTLGGYTFTWNPARSSGVPILKSRVDIETLGGNVTQVFGFFDEDRRIEYEWNLLPVADYNAVLALYQAGDGLATYTLDPEDGHTYEVEICFLDGQLCLNDRMRRDVRLILKTVQQLS